jgi:hypothetical protein
MRRGAGIAIVFLTCLVDVRVGAQSAATPVPVGKWGGKGLQLTVTTVGARLDYGCDAGTIGEQLMAGPSGVFVAQGTHAFGRGGPRSQGEPPPKPHRARYEGALNGDTLRLTVSLPDLGRKVGVFTLELGQRASLERCG